MITIFLHILKKISFYLYNLSKISIIILLSYKTTTAEPLVILEYSKTDILENSNTSDANNFVKDYNYSARHKTKTNETLSKIINNYYGKANLNKNIIQLAIVTSNKSSFVRNNPHYMYAGKSIYLPSINEIRNLVLNSPNSKKTNLNENSNSNNIFFFGSY